MTTQLSSSPSSLNPPNRSIPQTIPQTVPQTKGWPLIGNVLDFRRDSIGFLDQSWRQLGDIYKINVVGRSFIVLSNPELARQVLIDGKQIFQRSKQFNGGSPLALALGLSTLTTDGESWLSKRRTIQPIFHRQRIQGMGNMMVEAGVRMLERWQQANNAEIHLDEEMKIVTLDIINRTMFSTDILGEVDRVGSVVDIALHYIIQRIQNPLSPPQSWPTPANRRFQHAQATLDEYLYRIIRQRRASLASPTNPTRSTTDLLDMLIAARDEETGQGMNDEQLRNEVATIYAAGHETTSLALTWTWYALTQHPEVLRKLQQEVDTVLAGRAPTMSDLPNLPYTLQVLEESMRFFPPVPFTVRMAYESSELGGYAIPKGSMVMIQMHNIHRHPAYWERPEEFWPERFAPENKQKNQRTAYLPFLSGQHLCIGNHFSLMEGQLLLAMMAQHYEMELLPGQRIEKQAVITMRPRDGMKMRLVKRAPEGA